MTSITIPPYIRDNYEILRELGKGIFGVSYRALSKKDGKIYTIKIFSLERIRAIFIEEEKVIPTLEEMLENNRRIMNLLEKKSCENLRKIYKVGNYENPYVVTEHLDYNLKEYVERRGMSPQLAVKIILDVARGLKFVFDNTSCYCHGDISPGNIFIEEKKGEVIAKLGDFDGARFPEISVPVPLLNLDYRPPEPEPDREGRYDVYSLGVILTELILGKSAAKRIRTAGGEAVNEFQLVPEGLKTIIRGSTELSAEKRYTLNEFIKMLESFLQPLHWDDLKREARNVALLYKEVLETLRRNPSPILVDKIKRQINPKFRELAALWRGKRIESAPEIKQLISYLKEELSSLQKELS
jgi:serine/threonine protein kinase